MKFIVLFTLVFGLTVAAPEPKIKGVVPYSLIDDLMEFFALVPVDDILAITKKHEVSDAEFCQVVAYLQGDEWAKLIAEVAAKQEVQDFVKYLTDAGLPIDMIIEAIHELIQNIKCTAKMQPRSMRSYLDEIEAIIPKDKFKALFEDKMENSPDFQALFAKISSEDAHKLVEDIRAIPEVQRIAKKLEDMGVRVKEFLAEIYAWLGWGSP